MLWSSLLGSQAWLVPHCILQLRCTTSPHLYETATSYKALSDQSTDPAIAEPAHVLSWLLESPEQMQRIILGQVESEQYTSICTGMQKLVAASDALSVRSEFKAVSNLKAIDVISVRVWLDRKFDFKYPANVLAGFESQAGSTFFDLNALQVCSPYICCLLALA